MLNLKYFGLSILVGLFIVQTNAVYVKAEEKQKNSLLYEIKSKLLVHDAKIGDKDLEVIRMGAYYDGGYVVPLAALEASEALMGYGIFTDISFEREFSQRYNKPSYGFDCGVKEIETGDPNCHFFSECIGSSDSLYTFQVSSGKVSSFSEQRERFDLVNKKYFIKMDIEGGEFLVMNDILNYSKEITGFALEIHMNRANSREEILHFLSKLSEDFVLIHLHGCNFCDVSYYKIPDAIQLTYINKNLIDSYKLSNNQKSPTPIDRPDNPNKPEVEFEINPLDFLVWHEPYLNEEEK